MIELLINNTDAAQYGVRMGKGFLDALFVPKSLKEFVSNESRLEDGIRVLYPQTPKFAAREMTLNFQITGTSENDFKAKRDAFFALLYAGRVTLSVPSKSSEVFKLTYMGNSPTYKGGLFGHACKVAVKFSEPNPNDRS